jgi:hypothetical protein
LVDDVDDQAIARESVPAAQHWNNVNPPREDLFVSVAVAVDD